MRKENHTLQAGSESCPSVNQGEKQRAMKRLGELYDVVQALRGENGCSWDRAQTHTSLKPFLIEEAYETVDAVTIQENGGGTAELQEELGDLLFQTQSQIIQELADRGSCVIIGRCADFVLRNFDNVTSVFVHADREFCLEQAMLRNSMTPKEMEKYITKVDKYRGDFYRHYTGRDWSDARNYDLCLNSGKLGFEKCVDEIKSYLKIRYE